MLEKFRQRYGDKGDATFYASLNKGTLSAERMEQKGGTIRKRQAARAKGEPSNG